MFPSMLISNTPAVLISSKKMDYGESNDPPEVDGTFLTAAGQILSFQQVLQNSTNLFTLNGQSTMCNIRLEYSSRIPAFGAKLSLLLLAFSL